MTFYTIEIVDAKKQQNTIAFLENVSSDETVLSLKNRIAQIRKHLPIEQQSLRLSAQGKNVSNDRLISDLSLPTKCAQLFLRDLGPQVAWKTVFLTEYAGPLFIYPLFYLRPAIIYGSDFRYRNAKITFPIHLALLCWSFHYAKRLFETVYVHRFSNATMPRTNLLKNSIYYWGFAAYISYFINHPLYTAPQFGAVQVLFGLISFLLCEVGNLSVHLALRDLRPKGTRSRKVPLPTANPFTLLFDFVSCPNYSYEVGAWLSFSIITQSAPALIFATAGFIQMTIWALNKHHAYVKEFPDYPRFRCAIVPFLI